MLADWVLVRLLMVLGPFCMLVVAAWVAGVRHKRRKSVEQPAFAVADDLCATFPRREAFDRSMQSSNDEQNTGASCKRAA
ncbi:MAG TPA: hypothetical protein VGL25_05320 [Casimicrobiaceae bacterium]|jgi:hypothetical protein